MQRERHFINTKTKFILQLMTGIFIIGAFAWYFSSGNTDKLQASLKLLPLFSPSTLLMVILFDALQILAMSLRLYSLFPRTKAPSVLVNFQAMSVGQVMNSFLPARAGDFYKLNLLTKASKASFLTVTGVMAADKLMDFVAFILLILLSRSFVHAGSENLLLTPGKTTYILITVLGGIAFAFYLLRKRLKKAFVHLQSFLAGLRGLLSPIQVLSSLCLATFVWLPEIYAIQYLALGQGITLSFSQIVFILSVLNLAIAIPLSVANVGPFEASLIFALGKFDVGIEKALVIASAHHLLQIVGYLSCAAIALGIKKCSNEHKIPS